MTFLGPISIYWLFHGLIADTDNQLFPKILNFVFCFIINNKMYSMPYLFFKNFKNQDL